jgi:uncharacterized BrkB/YihY/UPF0761 family membrane protein
MNRQTLIKAMIIGLVLQLIMVVSGHYLDSIKECFGIVGMLISLIAGAIYVRTTRGSWSNSLIGGALAGGICALIGIAVSCALGDVDAGVLVYGTLGSAVAGLIGGAVAKLIP